MRIATFAILFSILALLSFANAAATVQDYDAETLAAARSTGKTLVKFYAPWCGHCQNMAAAYEGAAVELAGKLIAVGEVNCDKHKNVCREYGVTGYPTIILFANGNFESFHGERTTAAIVTFALNSSPSSPFVPVAVDPNEAPAPPVPAPSRDSKKIKILNSQSFEKKTAKGVWLIEFVLGSGFDADLIPIVNRLAEVLDRADVDVAKLNSLDDVAASEKLEITAFPTFVLIVNGTVHKYDGEKTFEAIYGWVNATSASYFEAKAKAKSEKRAAKDAAKAAKAAEKEKEKAAKAAAKAEKEEQKKQREADKAAAKAEKKKKGKDGEKDEKKKKEEKKEEKKDEKKKHKKDDKKKDDKDKDSSHGHDSADDDDDDDSDCRQHQLAQPVRRYIEGL